MVTKCSKCGANIPDNAGFCPACGKPKGATSQQMQPMAQSPGAGLRGIADIVFSKFIIMLGICICLLLIWIGALITSIVGGTVTIGGTAVVAATGWGTTVNSIMNSIGFAGMGFLLLGGGMLNNKFDSIVRTGMLVAGGFLLARLI